MQDNPFDKKPVRNYSREEELERFKKNIAIQKRSGKNNGRRGMVMINNGTVNKLILADLPIPEGWRRGVVRSAKYEQQGKAFV